jgi:hypothetical protein
MTTVQLRTPFLEGGIKSIHFFNGRLLSAEDLGQEQTAHKQARQQLGQAVGDGVVYGLQVAEAQGRSTKQSPVVTVSAGLAVNRAGQTLRVADAIDVALVRPPQNGGAPVTALFADCKPPQARPYVVGAGVYLLTIQPASDTDGKAPVSGLGNLDAACNARYQVDGVQFRLIQLPLTAADLSDAARLRNRVAYLCLGALDQEVTTFFANPFGPVVARYGLLDDLRPNCLKDDETPLAVIYWTAADGIRFVDMWSVRRRVTARAAEANWPLFVADRRLSEAEAMYSQFQEHVDSLRANEAGALGSMAATDRFRHLPPVGLLPIRGTNSPGGFDRTRFFGDRASKDVAHIDANLLRDLAHESLYHEPIDLSREEKIQLYLIHENVQAVEQRRASQLALVFASRTLPYRGVARFGYAIWNRSRFAPQTL